MFYRLTKKIKKFKRKSNIVLGNEEKNMDAFRFLSKIFVLNYPSGFLTNPNVEIFTARYKDQIIGAIFTTYREFNDQRFLHIDYIGVDFDYRRHKIADRLILKVKDHAKKHHLKTITVRTQHNNFAARKVLKRQGFQLNRNYISQSNNSDIIHYPYFLNI